MIKLNYDEATKLQQHYAHEISENSDGLFTEEDIVLKQILKDFKFFIMRIEELQEYKNKIKDQS